MKSSDLFFDKEVDDLLSAFEDSCLTPFQFPPVPVKPICEQYLGLSIREKELPKREAVGMLIEESNSILTRRGNQTYERFTLAHEIGHWLLHSKNGESFGKKYRKNLISGFARKSKTREVLQEIEANRFAASLLMPKSLVIQYSSRAFLLNKDEVARLARIFKVSDIAMVFRIKNIFKYSVWTGPIIDWEDLETMEREWIRKYGSNKSSGILTTLFLGEFEELLEAYDINEPEQEPVASLAPNSIFTKVLSFSSDLTYYYRRPSKTRRKLMIEFAGLPNAGKNTQIDFLVNDLRSVGYKVARLEEGFGTASADGRLDGQTQENKLIWSMGKLVQDIFNFGLDDSYDIVVLNRGPFDFLALTEWWRMKGVFTSPKAIANKDWILQYLKEWVDIVIYLDVTPEESVLREKEERKEVLDHLARKYHNIEMYPEQRVVNQMALEEMRYAYETTISNYTDDFMIIKIQTHSILQTAEEVLSSTQRFLHKLEPHEVYGPIQPTLPGLEIRPIVMKEDS